MDQLYGKVNELKHLTINIGEEVERQSGSFGHHEQGYESVYGFRGSSHSQGQACHEQRGRHHYFSTYVLCGFVRVFYYDIVVFLGKTINGLLYGLSVT